MLYKLFVLLCVGLCSVLHLQAQQPDTANTHRMGIDSFLLKKKGLIGQLAENIFVDTVDVSGKVQRNDQAFQRYRGRVIRNIQLKILPFGTPINDTSARFRDFFINIANRLHHTTQDYVIRNNLFFKKYDRVYPFLMADNERHFRDLDYLRDARIVVRPVPGSNDSVDVYVLAKDVLSIGGKFQMHNPGSATAVFEESDVGGMGDALSAGVFFDNKRRNKLGWNTEYAVRNIGGSFIDVAAGFNNYASTYSTGQREEQLLYVRLLKPLVHSYMRWTYALEASVNRSRNQYVSDSLYNSDVRYKYHTVDGWVALNLDACNKDKLMEDNRLRKLISMRVLNQVFDEEPGKFEGAYNFKYADIAAVLGAVSIFQQNFYKTRFIYGFGRTEDVPEGIDISLNAGWTRKNKTDRPYVGLDFQRFYFTSKEQYIKYTARAGAYFNNGRPEDIDILANMDYFSRLINIKSGKWKQRSFLSVGATRQINAALNEPLFIESDFGLSEFKEGRNWGGDFRVTFKGESVFYSPWQLLLFRFAPFAFGNVSMLNAAGYDIKKNTLYSSVGGGMRARNESLVFGTLEFKAYYFPSGNLLNERWRFEFNTNVKFKYNRQTIKRPELIRVN